MEYTSTVDNYQNYVIIFDEIASSISGTGKILNVPDL